MMFIVTFLRNIFNKMIQLYYLFSLEDSLQQVCNTDSRKQCEDTQFQRYLSPEKGLFTWVFLLSTNMLFHHNNPWTTTLKHVLCNLMQKLRIMLPIG